MRNQRKGLPVIDRRTRTSDSRRRKRCQLSGTRGLAATGTAGSGADRRPGYGSSRSSDFGKPQLAALRRVGHRFACLLDRPHGFRDLLRSQQRAPEPSGRGRRLSRDDAVCPAAAFVSARPRDRPGYTAGLRQPSATEGCRKLGWRVCNWHDPLRLFEQMGQVINYYDLPCCRLHPSTCCR